MKYFFLWTDRSLFNLIFVFNKCDFGVFSALIMSKNKECNVFFMLLRYSFLSKKEIKTILKAMGLLFFYITLFQGLLRG